MSLKPILAAVAIVFPAFALAQMAPQTKPPESTDRVKSAPDHARADADKANAANLYEQAQHAREVAEEQWEVSNELWGQRQEQLNKYHKPKDFPPPQRLRK